MEHLSKHLSCLSHCFISRLIPPGMFRSALKQPEEIMISLCCSIASCWCLWIWFWLLCREKSLLTDKLNNNISGSLHHKEGLAWDLCPLAPGVGVLVRQGADSDFIVTLKELICSSLCWRHRKIIWIARDKPQQSASWKRQKFHLKDLTSLKVTV